MVIISAIHVLFSDHPKCLDLIFMYLSGLMIYIGNLRLVKHASVAGETVAIEVGKRRQGFPEREPLR